MDKFVKGKSKYLVLLLVIVLISGVIVYWRYGSELRLPEGIRVPESFVPKRGEAMISYRVKSASDMYKLLYFMPGGEVYLVTKDASQIEDGMEKIYGDWSQNAKETCILIGKLSYEDRKQLTEFVSEIDHDADEYDMWRYIHDVPGSSKVELKQEESKQEEPKQEELEQEEPKQEEPKQEEPKQEELEQEELEQEELEQEELEQEELEQEEPESFDDIISNTRERIPYQVYNKRDALIIFFRFHDYSFTSEVWIDYLLCDESVIDVWKFTKNTWFFERYIQYVSSGEE